MYSDNENSWIYAGLPTKEDIETYLEPSYIDDVPAEFKSEKQNWRHEFEIDFCPFCKNKLHKHSLTLTHESDELTAESKQFLKSHNRTLKLGRSYCVSCKEIWLNSLFAIQKQNRENTIPHYLKDTLKKSGVPFEHLNSSFKNINPNVDTVLKKVKSDLQLMTRKFKFPRFIILTGNFGTGKTHLAVSIIRELYVSRFKRFGSFGNLDYKYFKFIDLIESLRQVKRSGNYETEIEKLLNLKLLVLDEINRIGRETELVEQIKQDVIEKRFSECKVTIMLDNSLTLKGALENFSGNLQDRAVNKADCYYRSFKWQSYRNQIKVQA